MSFGSLEQSRQISTSEVYSYAITKTAFSKLNTEHIYMDSPDYLVSCALDDQYSQCLDAGQISHCSLAHVTDGNMNALKVTQLRGSNRLFVIGRALTRKLKMLNILNTTHWQSRHWKTII